MTDSTSPRDDVDLGGYLHAVARRWWLVLLLAVIGAVTGVAWWYAQPKVYEATAAVYLGQPVDTNGTAINGVSSNARAAVQIVQGTDVVKEAVAQTTGGMTAAQIRNGLQVETPTTTAKGVSGPTNYVAITVRGHSKTKTAAAANALAAVLVKRLSDYSAQKVTTLQAQLGSDKADLAALEKRLAAAQTTLTRVAASGGTTADRAIAGAPYMTIVQAASTERAALVAAVRQDQLDLLVATQIEAPRIISPAAPADSPTRQSRSMAAVAGLFAGAVVGLLAVALLMRRRPAAAAA